MSAEVSVVVVGGGVMGVSLLYHLCRRGWRDVVLVEKDELTAGSTWHAAGLCTHFAHSATVMMMRAASVRLYRDLLPAETGESVGFHSPGALRVTRSRDRMDEFHHVRGLGQFVGYAFEILTPRELAEIYPLARVDDLLGAIHEPFDGHVDPTLATQALAAQARACGATILRQRAVRAIERDASGAWRVHTDDGAIRCQHVVNAAGTWCRVIGLMIGVDLPVVPLLHQYLVTDRVPQVAERRAAGLPELPIIRDPEESWYLRQEGDGLICGPYERNGQPWSVDGVPSSFGMQLLPPDLDRVEAIVACAMQRVPVLAEAGIKTVINGPITFTPDANPLIGPAFGLDRAWLLTGSSMGVMEGGGAGRFLADWIVDGSPPMDALAIDPRRFGGYADRRYRVDKAVECFGLQFGVHYPYEERAAGRPRRVTPILGEQKQQGAVFGCAYGWERPNWFARSPRAAPPLTFRRPGWTDCVNDECVAVRDAVGIADLSAFAKFELSGKNADRLMQSLGANRAPARDGRIGVVHALTDAGGVASEFTVTRLGAKRYYLTSAAAAERHDADLLRTAASAWGQVEMRNVTEDVGILAVMGPQACRVLGDLCDADLSPGAFPWLSSQALTVAGVAVRALRVSYVGESGFELHVRMDALATLYRALLGAGEPSGMRAFGAFAMNAMRLEKGYRAWGLDLTSERTPIEAGLSHLVRCDARQFRGRDALLARHRGGDEWRMVLLALDEDADPFYAHTVWSDGEPVGVVTSGARGARTGLVLALAYLRPGTAGERFEVSILDPRYAAHALHEPPYDPGNERLRGRAAAARCQIS